MSTPATALQQRNVTILSKDRQDEFYGRLHQRICHRAYELFEGDGGNHGNDHRHWLQAENEVMQRVAEVREAGAWLAANATLGDCDGSDLQVMVLPDRAIISGVKTAQGDCIDYLLIKWPVSIDPATAAAYVKGNTLTVTAKHAGATPGESTTRSDASSFTPARSSAAPADTSRTPAVKNPPPEKAAKSKA
jgi:hypothetical protein